MSRQKVPCFQNGKDCAKRKLGCRAECEEWQIYEKQQAEYREERYRDKQAAREVRSMFIERRNEHNKKIRR